MDDFGWNMTTCLDYIFPGGRMEVVFLPWSCLNRSIIKKQNQLEHSFFLQQNTKWAFTPGKAIWQFSPNKAQLDSIFNNYGFPSDCYRFRRFRLHLKAAIFHKRKKRDKRDIASAGLSHRLRTIALNTPTSLIDGGLWLSSDQAQSFKIER